jgi:hypothetical protein
MIVTPFCQAFYQLISNAAANDTKLTGKLDNAFILYTCFIQDYS